MIDKIVKDWVMIWVTLEPFGTLALFITLTAHMSVQERRKTAFRTIAYSSIILLAAIVFGQLLLAAMDIRLESFQIAGGVVLFLFGLQMIFGMSSTEAAYQPEKSHDIAVFPLTIPSLVGPEAIMAVIWLTDNHIHSITAQSITALTMLSVMAITFVMLLLAEGILRIIGKNGAAILERIMGMILTALSVELVMSGLGIGQWVTNNY